jgi:hypothetical protein
MFDLGRYYTFRISRPTQQKGRSLSKSGLNINSKSNYIFAGFNVPLSPYRLFLPAAFAFTQRALADAAIFALEAALIFRLAFFAAGFVDRFDPFTFAHLDLAAALILARPAALILRLGLAV